MAISCLCDEAAILVKVFVSRLIAMPISLDLCLSHTSRDVLSIMPCSVDSSGIVRHFYLRPVRVDNTSEDALCEILSKNLTPFEVEEKVISYVYDTGATWQKRGLI